MSHASEQILVEPQGAYTVVTMNRPARRNALGTESVRALDSALDACDRAEDCHAILLTGAPPAFCAGSDLKELGSLSIEDMCAHEAETARIARRMALLSTPVIAAVEGYALGGGFILATSCDIVVSGASARWSLPEVANGWIPPWGLQSLAARVGPVKARTLTWSVTDVDGSEAYRLGVADTLAPDGEALEHARAFAERLAALSPAAVASTKRFFAAAVAADGERQDAEASRLFAHDCRGETAQRALSRFTER